MTNKLAPGETNARKITDAVNGALDGKLNNTGLVTLTASASSTTVTDERVGANTAILFSPRTANAASIDGWCYVAAGDITPGTSFKITHDNNSMNDRTFSYALLGG